MPTLSDLFGNLSSRNTCTLLKKIPPKNVYHSSSIKPRNTTGCSIFGGFCFMEAATFAPCWWKRACMISYAATRMASTSSVIYSEPGMWQFIAGNELKIEKKLGIIKIKYNTYTFLLMHYYFRVAEANRMFQGEDEKRNTKGRINQQQKPGKNKKTQKWLPVATWSNKTSYWPLVNRGMSV